MDKVNSIEELEQQRAKAASQGASIPNYNEWHDILSDFEELGVQSTGSYEGDLALHTQMRMEAEQMAEQMEVEQAKEAQQTQQIQPQEMVSTDKDQALKATVANGVSSDIMANYMKVFHMI